MTTGLYGLLTLMGLVGVFAVGRFLLSTRSADADRPTTMLTLACANLPAGRTDWGRAMLAELACVEGRSQRWRFALGGVWTAMFARVVVRLTGRPSFALIVGAVAVSGALTVAALAAYQGLLAQRLLPVLILVLVVALVGYAVLASIRANDATPGDRTARRSGMVIGVSIGVAWTVFAAAWWNLHGWPMIAALVMPLAAGAYAARFAGGIRAGVNSVTWAGLVAGLLVFIASAIDAFATAGGPYDTGQIDEFNHSGYATIGTYWMGEGLAVSVLLLLFVPAVTVVVGAIGAVVGNAVPGRRRPAQT